MGSHHKALFKIGAMIRFIFQKDSYYLQNRLKRRVQSGEMSNSS